MTGVCKVLAHKAPGCVASRESDHVPIKPPLRVLDFRTVDKRSGWWGAVVLLESYARKQICFYLWQKKGDEWKRKQKFGVHSREEWENLKTAVESLVGRMDDGSGTSFSEGNGERK